MTPRDPDDYENESEFGNGPGLIDPDNRESRNLSNWEGNREIFALPKTFDNSMPDRPEPQTTPVPRLLPGETEADRNG